MTNNGKIVQFRKNILNQNPTEWFLTRGTCSIDSGRFIVVINHVSLEFLFSLVLKLFDFDLENTKFNLKS